MTSAPDPTPAAAWGPLLGASVRVRLPGEDVPGRPTLRPATVVREGRNGVVDVQVLLDGPNDVDAVAAFLDPADAQDPGPTRRLAMELCLGGLLWLQAVRPGTGVGEWRPGHPSPWGRSRGRTKPPADTPRNAEP